MYLYMWNKLIKAPPLNKAHIYLSNELLPILNAAYGTLIDLSITLKQ